VTPSQKSNSPSVFDYATYAYLVDAENVTELVLVRHAQQVVRPRTDPFESSVDPPVSEIGERQVKLVGRRFADERVDSVYASRLERAVTTAAAIGCSHGLQPEVVDDLREVELFRDLPPGRTVEEVLGRATLLGVRERMMHEKRWDVYPLSESSAQFRRRAVNAIEGIAAVNEGRRVVVVCHGGVINAYIAHHLGVHTDMMFRPQHTSVNVVLVGRHGVRALRSLGDVHHLSGDPELITY
jgi:probable phosphoglycerate mutase